MTDQTPDGSRINRNKLLIGVMSAAIAAVMFQQFAKQGQDARRASHVQQQWNDAEWKTQSMGELSLESPFELTPTAKYQDQLPPKLKEMIVTTEMSSALLAEGGCSIVVTHTEYREGLEIDVDGAIAGAICQCAEAAGDSDPKYSILPTTTAAPENSDRNEREDVQTRRGTYQAKPRGKPLWIDAVGLQRGQVIWVVIVASPFEATQTAVDRLLKSIRIDSKQ